MRRNPSWPGHLESGDSSQGALETPRAGAIAILESEIKALRRRKNRHTLFALLGVSPAAVFPMLGLAVDFGWEIVGVASVFVVGWEAWRAVEASADLREAELERDRILSGAADRTDSV